MFGVIGERHGDKAALADQDAAMVGLKGFENSRSRALVASLKFSTWTNRFRPSTHPRKLSRPKFQALKDTILAELGLSRPR